jgi:hypothetical protein
MRLQRRPSGLSNGARTQWRTGRAIALVALPLAGLLAGCTLPVHRNAGDPPAGLPVISQAAARRVLATYITTANEAGRLRSASLLATCESGAAEQVDAAGYAAGRAAQPGASRYRPLTYADPAFYIPRQWSYPRWFVVEARSQALSGPGTRPENGRTYLVFEQQDAVAEWLVVLKPDSYAEGKPLPRPEPGAGHTGRLAVPASQLAAAEAAYLNGTGLTGAGGKPFRPDKISGELRSMAPSDRARLAAAHPSVSDPFSPGPDGTFALPAAGGGALVFYSVTDTLADRVPAPYRLNIHQPLYSRTGLSELRFTHVTEFAAYDPPAGKGKPDVLASGFGVTGITGK